MKRYKKLVILLSLMLSFLTIIVIAYNDSSTVKADFPYLLFKKNSYVYNSKGKHIRKGLVYKHMTKGNLGSKRIKGHKYYKIGRNKYVKAANVTPHNMTQTFTLIHNAYLYGPNGKINHHYHGALKAGEQYFYIREATIKGVDYFQVGGDIFVKQSNTKEGNTYDMTTSSDVYNGNGYNYQAPKKEKTKQNRYGTNKIVLPSGYVNAISKVGPGQTNSYLRKLSYDASNDNVFHKESSADDKIKVDIRHLTPSQNRTISLFALNIINGWRRQAGVEELKYDSKSQQVADFVKQKYEIDKAGITTMHDLDALSYATEQAGLDTYPAECMGGQQLHSTREAKMTMTKLKKVVYTDLIQMVFNSLEFDHAKVLINWHSLDDRQTEFGWSVSWRDRSRYGRPEYSTHYILY